MPNPLRHLPEEIKRPLRSVRNRVQQIRNLVIVAQVASAPFANASRVHLLLTEDRSAKARCAFIAVR